jgi:regulatory protein
MDAADALQYAIRALSARALTEFELEKKLQKRQVSPPDIKTILLRLRELRFVNDQAIAAQATQNPALGKFGIKRKLAARGINKHLIEDALTIRDETTDFEAALELLEKHQNRFFGERAEQKAIAFLMRRGFSYTVIQKAIKRRTEETLVQDQA